MESFSYMFFKESGTMQVILSRGAGQTDFENLVRFYQEKINCGVNNWDVDLRQLDFINSTALGILVAFNANVMSRGGRLRLILQKSSKITDLITLTKLDRIIDTSLI